MTDESVTEASKAIQEVAKTTGQAIGVVEKLGAFFAQLMGEPLEDACGMIADLLKYKRWKRQMELCDSVSEIWRRYKTGVFRPVPPKFLGPIMENVAHEDDDGLRVMYARLLASASDSSMPSPRTAFSEIVRQMEPIDAAILKRLHVFFLLSCDENDLPDDVDLRADLLPGELSISDLQYRVSFDNLRRLGLVDSFFEAKTLEDLTPPKNGLFGMTIRPVRSFFRQIDEQTVSRHGGYSHVRMTALGVEFMRAACYADPEIDEIKLNIKARAEGRAV